MKYQDVANLNRRAAVPTDQHAVTGQERGLHTGAHDRDDQEPVPCQQNGQYTCGQRDSHGSPGTHRWSAGLAAGQRRGAFDRDLGEPEQPCHRVQFLGSETVPVTLVDAAKPSRRQLVDDVRLPAEQ
jgi:hypothetical protein